MGTRIVTSCPRPVQPRQFLRALAVVLALFSRTTRGISEAATISHLASTGRSSVPGCHLKHPHVALTRPLTGALAHGKPAETDPAILSRLEGSSR